MSRADNPRELAAEIRRRLGPPPELPSWPRVSIVVLNRNGTDHLRRLLSGLASCTDYPDLELILVDNASSDDSLDFIRTVEAPFPISILANHHNESFSDACNQGAELANGELLLFLNNDTQPFEPWWLRELVACWHGSGAGAVGATLIQADGGAGSATGYLVQQRGLIAREDSGAFASGFRDHMADPLDEHLGKDIDSFALSAACVLIGHAAFEDVGGFTHGYMYGGEDVDLSFKLRSVGLDVLCSGRALLIHGQGSISRTAGREQVRAWIGGNRRFFLERWGPQLRREYELRGWGGRRPATAMEFSYCLKAGNPRGDSDGTLDARTRKLLDSLSKALLDSGHRCLVLCDTEIDDLRGLEYDVAVHFRGPARYIPKPAQLNVLWSTSDLNDPPAIECSHYDLVVSGSERQAMRLRQAGMATPVTMIEGPRQTSALIAAVDARAKETGFRTRIT